jgi:hypothetical protein
MDRPTRSAIERATQRARGLLEADFRSQLEGKYDIRPDSGGSLNGNADADANAAPRYATIAAAIDRKCASGQKLAEAVTDYLRDAAFTTLNRFVALKMLEARGLVQQCVSRGEQSSGYAEFIGMAPGLALLPDGRGYRLYLESLFDELSTEVKVLFDRRDAASVLWPRRAALEALLQVLNAAELDAVWGDDETIGWVYQYFNDPAERKKMRDESQAPRNSRELAVRNQFFTPRYVVQFLTDNTLGRTWLEMHGERTKLAETCEYLVRPTGEPFGSRPRKDPRDLRILDPACGSGHFLLYAFDLLLTIYEEAWAVEEGAPGSELTQRTLREDYPDLAELRKAAPRLIVEYNLYGVDIDARCAQIAALALWLRAQRAYQELGIGAGARPRIRRTHIVVAEPMPDNPDLAEAFAAELEKPFQRTLFERMIEEMRLAGELGTLLQVERSLAADISRLRRQFLVEGEQTLLPGIVPKADQGKLDLSGITDETVFHSAEEAILAALRRFAESAGGADARRRLFAGDAAQGVALLDLVQTRFDVVLMNPPFGAASQSAKKEFDRSYPRTRNDMFAAFVERGIQLLRPGGLLGAITSRAGFFLSSFRTWREEILLNEAPPVAVADLGYGVMDAAMVEAAAYCLEKHHGGDLRTVFLRVLDTPDKALAIRAASHGRNEAVHRRRFEMDATSLASVPGSPFAYWASDRLRSAFGRLSPFESVGRVARQGGINGDDFRWLRLWWEVPVAVGAPGKCCLPIAKGGSFSPFYADLALVARWDTARETFLGFTGLPHRPSLQPASSNFYFRRGLTWPRRTQAGLSLRALPGGCIFADKGPAAFTESDNNQELLTLLALMNARAFHTLVDLQMTFGSYEVGVIQRTPIPDLSPADEAALSALSRRAWSLTHGLDNRSESSHSFVLPALLHSIGESLAVRSRAWTDHVGDVDVALAAIRTEIDERCFDLYGIDEESRRAIVDGFGGASGGSEASANVVDVEVDDDSTEVAADVTAMAAELISWVGGVAFGRFDLRLATSTRPWPDEPEPFDPLPVCSPGMLTGDDGLPLARPLAGYPLSFPHDGILVDDPGHPRDLTASARSVFEVVFGSRADAFWQEAAALLNSRDHDLRRWLASTFFDHHLRRYSKSRRKAPILWQLAIPSARYSVWCYAHRMTRDSLFAVQNDIVAPKLTHEDRRLSSLVTQAGDSPTARDRAEIAAQETLVDELRTMLGELRRVAPLWNPDLDDGIVLVMAPLWRLVPTHRAWQKELRSKWDELVAGRYDWAHLAMHLWPERVVPKCATDRSLAIAHGLEAVFWVEGPDGKWTRRPNPTRPVAELVAERTSPAVKAALASLLDAPEPNGGGKKKSGRKAGVTA